MSSLAGKEQGSEGGEERARRAGESMEETFTREAVGKRKYRGRRGSQRIQNGCSQLLVDWTYVAIEVTATSRKRNSSAKGSALFVLSVHEKCSCFSLFK